MWEKSSSGKLPLNFQHSLPSPCSSSSKVVLTVFPTGNGENGHRLKNALMQIALGKFCSSLWSFLVPAAALHFISFCQDEVWCWFWVGVVHHPNCFLKQLMKETDFQDNRLLHQKFSTVPASSSWHVISVCNIIMACPPNNSFPFVFKWYI